MIDNTFINSSSGSSGSSSNSSSSSIGGGFGGGFGIGIGGFGSNNNSGISIVYNDSSSSSSSSINNTNINKTNINTISVNTTTNNNNISSSSNDNNLNNNDKERKTFRAPEKLFVEKLLLDEMIRRQSLRLSKEERDNADTIAPIITNEFELKLKNAWDNNKDMDTNRYEIVTVLKLKNIAEGLLKDPNNSKLCQQLDEKKIKIYIPKKPLSGAQRRKLKKEKEMELQVQAEQILSESNQNTSASNDGILKRNLKPTELLGGTRGVTQSISRKLKTLAKQMSELSELMDEKIKRRQTEKEFVIKYNKAADINMDTIPQDTAIVDQNIQELTQQLMKQYKRKRELEIAKSISTGNNKVSPTMFIGNFTNGLGDTFLIKSNKNEVDETLVQLWNSRYDNYQTPSIYSSKTRREKKKSFKKKHLTYDSNTIIKKRKVETVKNDIPTIVVQNGEEDNSDDDDSSESESGI